jgi:hypothetical protein
MVSYGETRGLNTVSRYGTGLIPSCFAVLSLVVTSTLRLQDDTPRAAALDAPLLVWLWPKKKKTGGVILSLARVGREKKCAASSIRFEGGYVACFQLVLKRATL